MTELLPVLDARYDRNRSFAILGDSVTSLNTAFIGTPDPATTNQIQIYNVGYMSQALAIIGPQIQFDPINNFGLGGDLLYPGTDSNGVHPGIVSRVANVIASGVGNVVLLAGHNNVSTAGTALTDIKMQLKDIVTQLRSAGIRVFLGTLVPITGMGGAQNTKLLAVNEFIRQYAAKTPGVHLWDAWAYINDYTASSPQQKPTFTRYNDTLHPGVKCGYMQGFSLAQTIRPVLALSDQPFVLGSQSDAALTPNSAMAGSAGTITGSVANTTISGPVATNFAVKKDSGSSACTITCSLENPRTDLNGLCNGQRQVVSFSTTQSGGADERINIGTSVVTTGGSTYLAGDQVYAEATVELVNPINCYAINLELTETHTVAYQFARILTNDGTSGNQPNALMENVARTYKYILRTPVITTLSNTQNLYALINVNFNPTVSGGASGVVKVGDFAIRKVAS